MPSVVAGDRLFDLDHFGAQVGKKLRAPRACEDAAQIQDANSG
jgi:hypothetical protein